MADNIQQITLDNIDPAFLYKCTAGKGFVVRMSHDPMSKDWIDPGEERRFFFVSQPTNKSLGQRCMTLEDAFSQSIITVRRKNAADQAIFENWMAIHYVKA